jgi:hypothetical protein
MKKIIFVLIVLAGFASSCTKNFEDFNTDKKRPTEVPGAFLFANAQKALADQIASTNVNLNVWKLWAQYWTETTYTDEANYDIVNRTIADNTFRVFYRDILADLNEARKVITAEAAIGEIAEANQQNRLYIIDLLECYCYNHLLEAFGDIPYSEALDITNLSPKYDDALTVYKDLLSRSKAAANGLNAGTINEVEVGSFGENDLFYAGDVAMWIKFANSLQVKMAITLADADNATAKSYVESAYPGAFAMGENAQLVYLGGSNSNPLYIDMVQSGRDDFVPANTIVDIMNALNDPRRDDYFFANGDTYQGGIYGESSPYGQLSHVSDPIQAPTFPMVLLDYTEIAFYLAEAAERGYAVGGSAESYYNSGITSSILHWGGTATDVSDYLAQTSVAYSTATGTWKQKIGTQAWLAYYVRGMEGYTSWRRLDFPILNIAPAIETYDEIPVRFTYPIREQTLNGASYAAASSAIGGDELTTKIFWDKF